MKKRNYLLSLLLVLALVLSGCGTFGGNNNAGQEKTTKKGKTPAATKEVTIAVYSGDWEKQVRAAGLDQFEKDTGIKVNIVPGADAEWFTKLKASNGKNPQYDILILQPDTIQRAMSANLLEPLDEKQAPNLKDLYPSISKQFTKNGKLYAAGFSMGQLGIAYREDLVPVKPTKWSDLWNPQYKGHVAISPLTYSAGLQFFSGLIHSLGGKEKNSADVDKAFNKLAQLKGNAVSFPDNAGSLQTLIQRGDAWVVPWWDGRAFALQQQGMKIGFVYPEDGPVAAVASWAIAKGSPNMVNAYKLLNYLSSSKVQKAFGESSFYGMANSKVEYSKLMKSKVQVGEDYYKKLTWVDYATATPKLPDWTNQWSQTMGGSQ